VSEKRVLVLLAGGYTEDQVQKHLLVDSNSNRLFERTISAVPADTVWIIHNRINQGWWNNWYNNNVHSTFKDKKLSLFLDTQGTKGQVNNPSLWMTSGIPSLTLNFRLEEVVFGAIDTYFDNYNFMDEFISKEHAFVVAKGIGRTVVDLDWRGNLKNIFSFNSDLSVDNDKWVFTDMIKTTTKLLLHNGQLPRGSMADVVSKMIAKEAKFDVVKASGKFMDCGSHSVLELAKGLVSLVPL
jgi:hypothetical protein